jgi:diketogulonate reductase-like aldo/keto reductase
MYANEASTGAALKESGLARDQFFLTTKQNAGECCGARKGTAQLILRTGFSGLSDPRATFKRQLQELGVDYVDLRMLKFLYMFLVVPNCVHLVVSPHP